MRRQAFDQINMIPFIDIMLVLLAIVLTTASFVQRGILPVDLPQTNTSSEAIAEEEPNIRIISLDKSGQWAIDDTLVDYETLLKQIATWPSEQQVKLNIDKSADFNYFVQVYQALQTQGLPSVGILVDSEAN